jgi:TolA-binding protein
MATQIGHADAQLTDGSQHPAAGPDQHELYRAAHQAHFGTRNCAAALRAWDEYLSLAPTGRFSAEAQYNRALCLVRLGRGGDAAIALTPFARGAYGSYRQREARELLEALDASAP